MFEKVNLTPTGISVLKYLARSPGREFYLREIAKALGISVGGCHKILKNLHGQDMINRRTSGKNLYFSANEQNPALRYFKIFVNIQELTEVINAIRERAKKVILYGSCATGDDTLESDIDLLIVTEDVKSVKKSIERRIGQRLLKPIILAPHELIQLKEKDKAFYNEINKGIVLWRERDE